MSLPSRENSRPRRAPRPTRVAFDWPLAQQAAPLVRRIVEDIVQLKTRLTLLQRQIRKQLASRENVQDRFRAEDEVQEIRAHLRKVIDELHGVGVVLLDPVRGEVGFPTIVNGSLAYLVYRSEQGEIGHWRYRDQTKLRPIPQHWRADGALSTTPDEEGLLI